MSPLRGSFLFPPYTVVDTYTHLLSADTMTCDHLRMRNTLSAALQRDNICSFPYAGVFPVLCLPHAIDYPSKTVSTGRQGWVSFSCRSASQSRRAVMEEVWVVVSAESHGVLAFGKNWRVEAFAWDEENANYIYDIQCKFRTNRDYMLMSYSIFHGLVHRKDSSGTGQTSIYRVCLTRDNLQALHDSLWRGGFARLIESVMPIDLQLSDVSNLEVVN